MWKSTRNLLASVSFLALAGSVQAQPAPFQHMILAIVRRTARPTIFSTCYVVTPMV